MTPSRPPRAACCALAASFLALPACRPPGRSAEVPGDGGEGPEIHGTIKLRAGAQGAWGEAGTLVESKAKDLTGDFEVPEGMAVTLFAESPQLQNPSAIDVDERGRVWVTEAVNYRQWEGRNPGLHRDEGDRVVILEDSDGDGVCDSSKVFVQDRDLVSPLGIAVIADGVNPERRQVVVSCSPSIYIWTDEDGDDVPDKKETFLTGFGGHNHDHGVHSVVVGPDGRWYFAVGNAGPHVVTDRSGWTLRSGSIYRGGGEHEADNHPGLVSDDGKVWVGGLILRCEPDGTDLTVMAHNFRNQYEVALDSFGNMFTADNDDDGNACCRTTWVMEGGNYGYFSADGSRTWEADRRPGQDVWTAHWHQDDPGVMPAGTRNAAGGPTGVCVYEGEVFGKDWTGRVLNADAGANCVYAHVPVAKGAGIELLPGKLIASRPQSGETKDRWFRPSDVCASTDGTILVADWWDPGVGGHLAGDAEAYGRILRIAPKGSNPRPPRIDVSTVEGATAVLDSPAVHARAVAADALRAWRPIDDLPDESARGRARRLWILAAHGRLSGRTLDRLSKDSSADLRVTALRAHRSWLSRAAPAPPGESLDWPNPLNEMWTHFSLDRRDLPVLREWVIGLARDPPDAKFMAELYRSPLGDDGRSPERLTSAYPGGDRYLLEALGMCNRAVVDRPFGVLEWDERADELAWRSGSSGQIANLAGRAKSTGLPHAIRRRDLEALGFIANRAAGDAMLDLALGGPPDLRELATWWVRHNDETIWRDYKLAAQLPDNDRDGARMVWSSGVLTSGSVEVDVDVAGTTAMWLVVASGKLGNSCDWSDWIEPRLVGPAGEIRLAGAPWRTASAEWGSVNVGKNAAGGPLAIGGTVFEDGIGTHAFSEIGFDVPKGFHRFRATAGLDDGGTSQGGRPDVEFQVWTKFETDPAVFEEMAALLANPATPPDEADSLVRSLAESRSGGLLLIRLASEKKLSMRDFQTAAKLLAENPDLSVRSLALAHFPAPPPPDDHDIRAADVLALAGDASRGERIFFGASAQCSTCHAFHGQGGDVGPDLSTIPTKYGNREVLDAILHPSRAIAHGYDAWLVETKDGLLESGFLLADGDLVVLKDTQGKRHVIPAENVESKTKQRVSTMPDDVALGLSERDLADLLEFLRVDPRAPGKRLKTRVLFNGKDLDGWTAHLSDAAARIEDVWSVRDGILRCKGTPVGYLRTTEDFESFVLTLEWRFDPALPPGNSGVLMRMTGADQVWPNSIEAQIHHRNAGDIWNIGQFAMQVDPARTEGRRTRKALPCNEKPLGEWNRYVITLDGGELSLEVNGEVQNRAHWCAVTPGKICLQSEGAAIEFRNIEITPIER